MLKKKGEGAIRGTIARVLSTSTCGLYLLWFDINWLSSPFPSIGNKYGRLHWLRVYQLLMEIYFLFFILPCYKLTYLPSPSTFFTVFICFDLTYWFTSPFPSIGNKYGRLHLLAIINGYFFSVFPSAIKIALPFAMSFRKLFVCPRFSVP